MNDELFLVLFIIVFIAVLCTAIVLFGRRSLSKYREEQVIRAPIISPLRVVLIILFPMIIWIPTVVIVGGMLDPQREHSLLIVCLTVVLGSSGIPGAIFLPWTRVGELVFDFENGRISHCPHGKPVVEVDLSRPWQLAEATTETHVGVMVVVGIAQEDDEVWFHYNFPIRSRRVEVPEGHVLSAPRGQSLGAAGQAVHERLRERLDKQRASPEPQSQGNPDG